MVAWNPGLPACRALGVSVVLAGPSLVAAETKVDVKPSLIGQFIPLHDRFTLYEPIVVEFYLFNSGSGDFKFMTGCDYRHSHWRHLRFKIAVTGPDERQLPGPFPGDTGGGIGGMAVIRPNDSYHELVLLNPWADFSKPGRYKVTARRTLDEIFVEDPITKQQFPLEIRTTFAVEVLPLDRGRLKQVLRSLKFPFDTSFVHGTAFPSDWYLESLADQLGVSHSTYRNNQWTSWRDPKSLRAGILRKLDERTENATRPR